MLTIKYFKETTMEYSPILITVYNRVNHFKKCIESLKNCHLSKHSHLFIAIDAPCQNTDMEANKQIVEYSKSITGFKENTLFIRNQNLGTRKNIDLARHDIFQYYDRLIFSEDDNIFSSNFLKFMNHSLDTYESRDDIFSISGYQYPIRIPNNYDHTVYIWQGLSAWGFGIWKNKWEKMDFTLQRVNYWLKDENHLKKLDKVSQHYRFALKTMQRKNRISGDGFISSYLVENNMYSVFPTRTLVKNIGHDGMGNNKFISKKFLKQDIDNGPIGDTPYDIQPDKQINKRLWWYFSNINRLKDRGEHLVNKLFQK